MKTELIAFTDAGEALARRLADALGGTASRCGRPEPLSVWAGRCFANAQALIFVGAAGIAVRAIAPHLRGKAFDPAVIVMDECGQFAVPILSGHLGGANDLARRIAALTGAVPVLTTATDTNGVFAADSWAKGQGCAVANPENIKNVSAALLSGGTVTLRSPWPVAGSPPKGVVLTAEGPCDLALTVTRAEPNILQLVPRIAVLGVGCRQNISAEAIEEAYRVYLAENNVWEQAVYKVCSIDRKADEPGLRAFCAAHGLPLETFSAGHLRSVPGSFSASSFVEQTVGVDNVCERAAVLGSGGTLYRKKAAGNGVTMALALSPFTPDWRWMV